MKNIRELISRFRKGIVRASLCVSIAAALPALAFDGGQYTPNAYVYNFTNASSAAAYTGSTANAYTNIFTANIGAIRQRSVMLQLEAYASVATTNVIAYAWNTDGSTNWGATSLTNISCAAGKSVTLIPLSTLGAGYLSIVGITNTGAGAITTNGSALRIPLNYNAP